MKKSSLIFLLSFGLYWASFGQAKEETNVLLSYQFGRITDNQLINFP